MKNASDILMGLVERITAVTDKPGGLDAKEVASILLGVEDSDLRRMILGQFLVSACTKGDVSEVVAWAVVMSHVEGRRPAPDVQLEALHLITQH